MKKLPRRDVMEKQIAVAVEEMTGREVPPEELATIQAGRPMYGCIPNDPDHPDCKA